MSEKLICKNCGNELKENALFCGKCGTKVEKPKKRFCFKCGNELKENASFCGRCGTKVKKDEKPEVIVPVIETNNATEEAVKEIRKPLSPEEVEERLIDFANSLDDYLVNDLETPVEESTDEEDVVIEIGSDWRKEQKVDVELHEEVEEELEENKDNVEEIEVENAEQEETEVNVQEFAEEKYQPLSPKEAEERLIDENFENFVNPEKAKEELIQEEKFQIIDMSQNIKYQKNVKIARKYYERKKRRICLGRIWDVLESILWIIFGGLYSSILTILLGASYCVTIIGIPFGIVHFKSIKLIFSPVNKRVVLHFGRKPFLNILWLIFGGLEISLVYFLLGLVFMMTIIFSDVGMQFVKIATYFLAPFGATILGKYEFETEEDKKIIYTYQYMKRNNIVIKKGDKLAVWSDAPYIRANKSQFFDFKFPIITIIVSIIYYLLASLILILIFFITIDDFYIGYHEFFITIGDVYMGYHDWELISFFAINVVFLCNIFNIIFSLPRQMAEFYGYINVPNAIFLTTLKQHDSTTRKYCMEYYNLYSKEIDEFIKEEYVY